MNAQGMGLQEPSSEIASEPPSTRSWIYRHAVPVRLFHWINAVSVIILLMSGLQIFNAYPRLHWGNTGYFDTPAIFEITGEKKMEGQRSWIEVNGNPVLNTTGVLGIPFEFPPMGTMVRAFPSWMTLPSANGDLHNGRGWHFLALYVFAFNLLFYCIYGFLSGRFRRTLRPDRDQLRPRAIGRDLWMHLRLKHASGVEAARYNLMQKLAYIGILFVLMPMLIFTGMTMSPSALTRFPWLIDLFDGRQSARTIHFICATLMALFILVHLFQLFVAGVVNETRSMITGWFHIPEDKP